MRKVETVTAADDKGQPVTLTFQRLTIEQEEQYIQFVQDEIQRESRSMLRSSAGHVQIQVVAQLCKDLSAGTCSLTGQIGAERCLQGAGMRKFLQLAAAEKHPGFDDATAYELVADHYADCVRVVRALAPAASAAEAAGKADEGKAAGGKK